VYPSLTSAYRVGEPGYDDSYPVKGLGLPVTQAGDSRVIV